MDNVALHHKHWGVCGLSYSSMSYGSTCEKGSDCTAGLRWKDELCDDLHPELCPGYLLSDFEPYYAMCNCTTGDAGVTMCEPEIGNPLWDDVIAKFQVYFEATADCHASRDFAYHCDEREKFAAL